MSRATPNQLSIKTIKGTVPKPKSIWASMNMSGTPKPINPNRNFLFRSVRNWSICILGYEVVVV